LRLGSGFLPLLTTGFVSVLAFVSLVGGCTFGPPPLPTTSTSTSTTSTTTTTTTTTLPPTTTSTSTTSTSTTSTTTSTTTTTIPLIIEGAVVIVANASGVTGAAALLTQELAAVGFQMADATNTAGVEERLDVSKVYYLPAGADVATSIGRVMGGVLVTRMPVPVSITGGPAALGEATVVVMLGMDLANNKPILPG
jgi:LytR cell envelope-related transcriptional attenuator